jgi:RHS repeat-associated protein
LQAVQTSNPSQNFFTTPDGEVLAYSPSSGTFVPLTDVLGSTIGLVNSSGSIATKYTYEPFGVPTISGSSSSYPHLFAGMEYDPTGLYHTYARYYSPRLQRFTQEDFHQFVGSDPFQFGGGDPNLFSYGLNDPVENRDPTGQQLGVAAIAAIAGTGAIVGFVGIEIATGGHASLGQIGTAAALGAFGALLGVAAAAGLTAIGVPEAGAAALAAKALDRSSWNAKR